MNDPKRIVYLTGFMGSGKSTIGPELARRLDYDFVDIDDVVEEEQGLSIAEIFRRDGEEFFRSLERKVLNELSGNDRKMVVALGGGTLTSETCRSLVKRAGVLVYLKADPKEIFRRVRRKRNRPMLLSTDGNPLTDAQLVARLEKLLKERETHYMEADIIVSTSELTMARSVDEIILKLKGQIA
jgi:shikimate kinase